MITEKDIKAAINKYFWRAILLVTVMTVIVLFTNSYFFNDAEISPLLYIVFSISGCTYLFKNVLQELFTLQNIKNES
jgi:hypothetical protein